MKKKAKRNIGREILEGIQEIKQGKHARTTIWLSVSEVRKKAGLSQAQFSELLGVSLRTLQEWEQGRRAPTGAARTLIRVASHDPKALLAALT